MQYRQMLDEALLAADPTEPLWALVSAPDTDVVFPELPALAMDDPDQLHKDVLDHSIRVVAKTPARLEVRLAALTHDIGKPATRKIDGRDVTFRNHEDVGAQLLHKRLPLLGYRQATVDHVATIVQMSGRFKDFEPAHWSDSAVRRFITDAGGALDDLLDLCEVDVTSKYEWKHQRQRDQIGSLRIRIDEVRAADARRAERPDLDGAAVMAHLGLSPGPQVGEALAMLLATKRERGRPLDNDEATDLLDQWWAAQS